jgi:hypothetical protein
VGFVEHLREFVGREATLEKAQASLHGAHYTYLLEFTSAKTNGERVLLKEVWTDCVLVENLKTRERLEIPIERIKLGS